MSPPPTARVACAPAEFLERAPAAVLWDWRSYFDPSVVLVTGSSRAPRAVSRLRREFDAATPVFQPAGTAPSSGPHQADGVEFVFAPTLEAVERIAAFEDDDLDTDTPTFVLGDHLELEVDTTSLSTSLVGREAYFSALSPEELDGEYVHVAAGLPAEYRREWDGQLVVGAGAGVESGEPEPPLVALDCRADGRALVRSLNRSQLGLRALEGVGPERAGRLREAGYERRGDVADADVASLADLAGIGRATAERIHGSARAIAREAVVRTGDEPLPGSEPVYVDIETDGLNPTVTWLVGVLDGSAAGGRYRSFLATDPDDPGEAVAEFLAWYDAEASGRPLVAYNGRGFDFPTLREHAAEYCPWLRDVLDGADTFDPYAWAVEAGNAVLPGRTNGLADVAGALGHERAEPGLTGAAVARTYRRWAADPSPATEPDWDRLDAYCEDDVRALATAHEALAATDRIAAPSARRDSSEETTQQTLSEW